MLNYYNIFNQTVCPHKHFQQFTLFSSFDFIFSTHHSFLKESLKPLIENETQLLYVLCLYGPFVQRFQSENNQNRRFFEVTSFVLTLFAFHFWKWIWISLLRTIIFLRIFLYTNDIS